MAENAARFLGFAFASADLLFEIDPDGKVVFVMGAVQRVAGLDQAQALGRPWRELIADADQDRLGIAITAASTVGGHWEYSIGGAWTNVGTGSPLLLGPTHRLRSCCPRSASAWCSSSRLPFGRRCATPAPDPATSPS